MLEKSSFLFIKLIIDKLKKEVVFTISFFMAMLTSIIKIPKLYYINFQVIILLFNLMIVVKAFEKLKIMDKIAINIINKYKKFRKISFILIVLTFFSAMLVTNDVALLTFVPLTLIISKKSDANFMTTVILQTLAANIGSSFTPMGNPQNLFLFKYYKITSIDFFKVMLPFCIIGLLWIVVLNIRIPNNELTFKLEKVDIKDKRRIIMYALLFAAIIASVFNLIDYKVVFILTLLGVIVLDKELIKKVDYFLLGTFICFFIFIGNISNIEVFHTYFKIFLSNKVYTYFTSIILSQLISNVPCAILVSGFTDNWKELLLGANIGGIGTIVASLASVISYKIYMNANDNIKKDRYLYKFHLYNFTTLIIFTVINYVI